MAAFLTAGEFRALSAMPPAYLDQLEATYPESRDALGVVTYPGFVQSQLELESDYILSRLAKRYGPFIAPFPLAVKRWLAALVTLQCWQRRGFDPTDSTMQSVIDSAERAHAQLKEAADARDGLFDLPLRADVTLTGISRGGPISYTQTSPFVGKRLQREQGMREDIAGSGTRWGRGGIKR